MLKKISIKSFLKDGVLGGIEIGMNKTFVYDLLGKPDDNSYGKISIERYMNGSVELTYIKNIIILIAIYFDKGVFVHGLNHQKQFDFDIPLPIMNSQDEFKKWIKVNNLKFIKRDACNDCIAWESKTHSTVGFKKNKMVTLQKSLQDDKFLKTLI